ncbi:hypothetical protein PA39016_003360000 [Pseudomonas aeruginosa 39016]|nr:hypothetical protein CSB94_1720 [Pseudomonas aeruginosa]AVK13194.1 hypothetical protein CSB91_4391 [Pseudomonas aeruginosa]EFQ42398.1 hypothetical protein PA39016_003360000 [Pseudomonas aeruginosa 39016]RCH23453.1 hypothetical protein CSC42_3707 [Pseudomonas aeruginosa]
MQQELLTRIGRQNVLVHNLKEAGNFLSLQPDDIRAIHLVLQYLDLTKSLLQSGFK